MCTYGCIGVVANEVNYLLAISLAGGVGLILCKYIQL